MGDTYRVLLLVYGVCLAVTARSSGVGPPRPVASLNDQHQYICSLLPNCTTWCSDCTDRMASKLFDFLNNCDEWKNAPATGYQHVFRCRPSSSYVACICATEDPNCRRCEYSVQNNLVCFSQENGDIHVWPFSEDVAVTSVLLEDMCPTCSCSTKNPTTPQPPTTVTPIPTVHFEEPVPPKPSDRTMTTDAGATQGPDVTVIIGAVVGGGTFLVLVIIGCVCYQRKCQKKNKKPGQEQSEYAYIDSEEMRTLRSQASMMTSQQFVSNDGILPPSGHRIFHNEMYGLNNVGNGATLSDQRPELPGNHPPPSNPPPASYQALNKGQARPADVNAAIGVGQCPRCRQMATDRSATAPLLDRPAGGDNFPAAVDGTKNPYMPLIKNNTCPTPGVAPTEPMCRCHSRPLSECSSVTGSVLSEPQGSHTGPASTLNSTGHESDQRPLSEGSDMQENPYYFKVNPAAEKVNPSAEKEARPSPTSEQYFKLEDAETLPLDSKVNEITPMLPSADDNGNNVALKPVSNDKGLSGVDLSRKLSSGQENDPYMSLQSRGTEEQTLPIPEGTVPSSDSQKETVVRAASSEAGKGFGNGDCLQQTEGQKQGSKICAVSLESTV
ncbi:uncharacterized protein LOC110974512 [Acanthaster planci]|uniref:Uncharacterized protein LOC110974512 n=1 Tax=Acanthaster planci TaxID=133434 RepID=A0A8B7XM66_ACAPL|nr:uncharacterized protein LOC110974512 [Acanthaster planci]